MHIFQFLVIYVINSICYISDGNQREIRQEEEEDQYDNTENLMAGDREQVRPEGDLKRARALYDYQAGQARIY
jgi:hypothetical protein